MFPQKDCYKVTNVSDIWVHGFEVLVKLFIPIELVEFLFGEMRTYSRREFSFIFSFLVSNRNGIFTSFCVKMIFPLPKGRNDWEMCNFEILETFRTIRILIRKHLRKFKSIKLNFYDLWGQGENCKTSGQITFISNWLCSMLIILLKIYL